MGGDGIDADYLNLTQGLGVQVNSVRVICYLCWL